MPLPFYSMILYNHVAHKIGAYAQELARHIPQGDNWKDIPLSISDRRLDGIRAIGGRTTYYGRMRWDAPSYTIATYFNHVGNGCNLHPSQDRVMSTREAARLQSFPDDFVFVGSKASQFKQIGNAVPPLLICLLGVVDCQKVSSKTVLTCWQQTKLTRTSSRRIFLTIQNTRARINSS